MTDTFKNLGFKEPVDDGSHYRFGAGRLPAIVLQPDGSWKTYLPDPEEQNKRGIETYDCTGFGVLNDIEMYMWRVYGIKVNYSDRWVGIIAGTGEGGNDPHTVCEAIRKHGLIPEEILPFSDDIQSIDEYYSFKGADKKACERAGEEWLSKYKFGHEDVFDPNQPRDEKINNMRAALKCSPLGISVFAWELDNRGVYVSLGRPNHWTSMYGMNDKDLLNVFDSYDPFEKLIDQDILYCKRYSIERNLTSKARAGFLEVLKNIWASFWSIKEQVDEFQKVPVVSNPVENKIPITVVPETPVSKYKWETPEEARHSFRMICDERKLSVEVKNKLCQVLNCESGFKVNTVHKNNDKRKTTDFGIAEVDTEKLGIAQFNDYWYKHLISPEDALNDPEKACRLFIDQYLAGQLKDWVCYSSGKYKEYKA